MFFRSPGTIEAIARGCNWLTYLCLPLWLTPAQFGSFSFMLALVLLVSALGTAGQDRVILRYVSPDSPRENKARISVAFLSASIFSLTVFGCAYIGLNWFDMHDQLAAQFFWVVIWGVTQSIYMLLISLSRALNRNRNFLILRGVYGLIKLSTLLLIAGTTQNVKYLVMAEALLLLIVSVYSLISFRHFLTWPNVPAIWLKSLSFGLPLILHILAGASLGQLDKLMIANMLEATALGIYAFINSIAGGVFFIFAVVNIVYEAKVYQLGVSDEAERLLKRMFKISMLCAASILLVANITLPHVLELVNKENYYHLETILILSAAYLIYPFYLQANIRFALKEKTKYIPAMTSAAATVNVALNLTLIPTLGITGAAISTLIAYVILVSLAQWTSRKV
ncbi:MAG: O-antigen/teichoic acid export membrane protein [Paraglaciecola sp.]